MTTLPSTISTASLRSVRLRARLPRIALWTLVTILCLAGLKAIMKGPPPAPAAPRAAAPTADVGAQSYAEAFAHAYLSWTATDPSARDDQLRRFLPSALAGDAGVTPTSGTDQDVAWTSVVGVRERTITVAAQTVTRYPAATNAAGDDAGAHTARDTIYLAIPVARDRHGFLYVMDYPAVVGAPPTTRAPRPPLLDAVDDAGLTAVVGRALTNYLAGARANLLADLAPDAVVSLPTQRLRVTDVGEVSWVRTGSRVAVQVAAESGAGTWTLRYELEVRRRDRWYVQSLQVDPTSKGAR